MTRFLIRTDYNVSSNHKVSFWYNHLDSVTDVTVSSSSSLGLGRGSGTTNFLGFQNSNYQILENIRSGIAEWHSFLANTSYVFATDMNGDGSGNDVITNLLNSDWGVGHRLIRSRTLVNRGVDAGGAAPAAVTTS